MSNLITNNPEKNLKQRISQLIPISNELKFLVGFFYFSGISELYQALKDNSGLKLKILVGLEVDKRINSLIEFGSAPTFNLSKKEIIQKYFNSVRKSINSKEYDNEVFYEQVHYFIDLIKQDRLIIRKTLNPNHSKLYIFNTNEIGTPKLFITGSSNLTSSGLSLQNELNVELSDFGCEEVEGYFDELWEEAVQITEKDTTKEELIRIIENKTLIKKITPFEAYFYVLKNYIESLNQEGVKESLKELLVKAGYKVYKYQTDAVSQAVKIINENNGVVIADVVGLGKSIIASLVAKNYNERGIVICPPGLAGKRVKKTGWWRYIEDFKLDNWEVCSVGNESLEELLKSLKNNDEYKIIIVDEVHRFRNQDTEGYELLQSICRDKKVILLTATPLNNNPEDIFALLKLFIIPGKSKLTLDDDLTSKFTSFSNTFRRLSNIRKNYRSTKESKRENARNDFRQLFGEENVDITKVIERTKYLSETIKRILEPVVIRRNRIDLKKDPEYSKEVYELSNVLDPQTEYFELTTEQSEFYDEVIEKYFGEDGQFKGAIYRPFIYEKGISDGSDLGEDDNFQYQSQNNLYDFMRRLLVKRFESSFGSFRASIERFKEITGKVQTLINNNGVYFLNRPLLEKIFLMDDIDEIEEELQKYKDSLGEDEPSKYDKVYKLEENFNSKDLFIQHIKEDGEMFDEILEKLEDLNLVENDPKLIKVAETITEIINQENALNEPKRKIIIFSEYADTVEYLENYLEATFPNILISTSSNFDSKLEKILENFDGMRKDNDPVSDEFQILLTTDKMSEGFNLNRAGAIINYDIPWNPTRVIQRLGRINRIGKKIFNDLYIYNFFPTLRGENITNITQIAQDKIFMIHNALGEDVKLFDVGEEPSSANLFNKVTVNPEDLDQESDFTKIRIEYYKLKEENPQLTEEIKDFPARIKVAKEGEINQLAVFIRKGIGFHVVKIDKTKEVEEVTIMDVVDDVRANIDTPAIELSGSFWENYSKITKDKGGITLSSSQQSIETKAINTLKTILESKRDNYIDNIDFIETLLEDVTEYRTLSDYTLRKISELKVLNIEEEVIADTNKAITELKSRLGEDYLVRIKARTEETSSEVIVAIENIIK